MNMIILCTRNGLKFALFVASIAMHEFRGPLSDLNEVETFRRRNVSEAGNKVRH